MFPIIFIISAALTLDEMNSNFTCLYCLENQEHIIMEIKRYDLEEKADIADICLWLIIEKQPGEIRRLTFRSMDSSGEVQERFFDQGYLKFNTESGTFIEKFNSGQHQLVNKSNEPLPAFINEILADYLSA